MKLALATMMLLSALPVSAESIGDRSNRQAYNSQRGYASENRCYRNEYREEYIPGTSKSPGYVSSYKERVEVPCNREVYRRDDAPRRHNTDDNSCIEGSILGGIAGGGIGAAASRGDGRLWAIPLGIVGGAMAGCQIDGG
ncbi:cAMP phosphodiesterase [Cyanophage S-RIM12_RW_29_1109]|uniref:cAMP phosphodiesterase n=7 Tax=Brizovirus TaxID=2733098 RepID=A0A1D7SX99_9CAUD|nr:cAMP phosphodiesterase [Prochlorococcus phage Syn33]YP_009779202.1 cAMP phosphodiesterase [Cyanophage S-RIM12 isolate RW_06_0310]YP_009779417.1 cAMP phosphodiesterase [Cyanophage S-RIM12 isolate W1_08_0910]AOO15067.1 cAMP phosphodiesterase [Cyanophage S-RIM12_Np_14_0310]AOO15282.1 cAMP phosphodiesterase [Cyanophage S-RIM12_Np_15_0310]AOO15494.1 cAMP phosphodiesterase [Cyanophage S-RIM12_Np_22_1112]AOO15922.1 cAMP phosphodiesterase [Cyanophage S-RIM12_RW_04_0310]AOO16135.1 cAMP phosphodies